MAFWGRTSPSEDLKKDLRLVVERLRFSFTSLAHQSPGVKVVQEKDHSTVLSGVPFVIYNGVFLSRISPDEAKARWPAILKTFHEKELPGMVCLGPDSWSEESESVLLEQNCSLMGREFDLALDIKKFKLPWFIPKKIILKEALTPAQKANWVDLFFTNFKLEDFAKPYFHALMEGSHSLPGTSAQFFLAEQNGKSMGTVALVHEGDITGVYCVSVNPESRSLGAGTMMMAAALRYMQKTSCRYMVGNSNEAGFRIYKKASGLIHLGETRLYSI